jgi:hypothetical protein
MSVRQRHQNPFGNISSPQKKPSTHYSLPVAPAPSSLESASCALASFITIERLKTASCLTAGSYSTTQPVAAGLWATQQLLSTVPVTAAQGGPCMPSPVWASSSPSTADPWVEETADIHASEPEEEIKSPTEGHHLSRQRLLYTSSPVCNHLSRWAKAEWGLQQSLWSPGSCTGLGPACLPWTQDPAASSAPQASLFLQAA